MYCVIMAGGSGTRFWPLSRKIKPKQLLNIIGQETMLQMTVDRLRKISFVEDIFIVTGPELAESILKSTKGISEKNLIIEPSGKNTAPCISLAALKISLLQSDAVMGVFPADHLIENYSEFLQSIKTADLLAKEKQSVVTIGVTPTFPSTAFGYIQKGERCDSQFPGAYLLKGFTEKPGAQTAEEYVSSGDYLWNSGMFIWRVNVLLSLIKSHMPDLHRHLDKIKSLMGSEEDIAPVWDEITPQSIDYGIMEQVSSNSFVVKADFEWDDVGSWNAVYDILPKDNENNVIHGNGIVLSGSDNLIHSPNHFTAVVGLDNVVVVHTEDATLVVHKDKVEKVKTLVKHISETGKKELL